MTKEEWFKPVLDWLDAGARHTNYGFNMDYTHKTGGYDYTGTPCGTAMCIAGAIAQFNGLNTRLLPEEVAEVIDISEQDGARLFYASNDDYYGVADMLPEGTKFEKITPQWAARVIRHYLATGEVDWVSTQ